MQRLVWQNSLGNEIDLTKTPYGITNWEGFSNTSLNIQSQQVPFQDGGVFLDALLEQREITVTLAIQDNNNLENRYKYRRELVHNLNPKLGEGYLIYTNDFISKRIKCVPEIPLFENHNSNDTGTPKASLTWIACEPYWEDLEQKSVSILSGGTLKVQNDGDVTINPTDIYVWGEASNVSIKNITNNTQLKISGTVKDIDITLGMGQKDIKNIRQYISYIGNGKVAETDFYQYILANDNVLKTADFKSFENVVTLTDSMDITSDGKNIYVCGFSFIGMIKENGDYIERTDINADTIYYSKTRQKIYYNSHTSNGIYSLDSFNSTPVLIKDNISNSILCFSDINDDVFACGTIGYLINLTQDSVIPTEAGNKELRFIAPYRNGYAIIGTNGFAQYNENGTWIDIPLDTSVTLNGFCYNSYLDCYYFCGNNGFLAEIRNDDIKININLNTEGTVSYIFFSKLFETVQFVCNGIMQLKNETEVVRITQNDVNFTCCKYVDFLGKYIAGSQDSIFTSYDFNVWEQVFFQNGIGVFTHIESDNTHIILGIENSSDIVESSDGVNFIKKQSIVGKSWVTYNPQAKKFFFIGDFGNNEYWICSVNNLLSNNVTKIYQIDTSNWNTAHTNSASSEATTVFILYQNTNTILYYTTDGGETWSEKISSCINIERMLSNSFTATRIVNQKILITINRDNDSSLPYFIMWDSQQEDFITPSFIADENYSGFEVNYIMDSPYICGYIDNETNTRCIVLLNVEGTAVTITKVIEDNQNIVQLYMSAVMVGNQLVYSYLRKNGIMYSYYNGELYEGGYAIKIRGYIAILTSLNDQNYWIVYDNNFNEVTKISSDYLSDFLINIPNDNTVLSNGDTSYGIINSDWQLTEVPKSIGNIISMFNFNEYIYIADSNNIYTENFIQVWSYEYNAITDCKVFDNKLFISQTNGNIKVVDKNFTDLQSIDVYPGFEKIYPMQNGDIVGFAKSGDIKSIYKYDHILKTTKKIYELNDQITTFYDLGYFDTLNEVLVITNRGFIGIIEDYITEFLNSKYTTYAFVKNKQPNFVGIWGFRGTINIIKGNSIINQIKEMTLKLNVGENNLVFGYEGNSTMMMNLIYSQKYIGV